VNLAFKIATYTEKIRKPIKPHGIFSWELLGTHHLPATQLVLSFDPGCFANSLSPGEMGL
jgi:hypothetical protein